MPQGLLFCVSGVVFVCQPTWWPLVHIVLCCIGLLDNNHHVISTQCGDTADGRTTRSRAQEETYSSSSEEDEEEDSASEAEGSKLESSLASSVKDPPLQV